MSLSTLCLACGFCCDGVLFDHVALSESENKRLPGGVVRLVVVNARPVLLQPCSALTPKGCSVYEQRPSTCRTFVCLLGRALEEGETSTLEALRVVQEAHALRVEASTDPSAWSAFLRRHFLGRHAR